MGFCQLILVGHQLSVKRFNDLSRLAVVRFNLFGVLLDLVIQGLFLFCELVGQTLVLV